MRFLSSLFDLLFPKKCLNCGNFGSFLCPPCLKTLPIHLVQHCPHCLRESAHGALCDLCRRFPQVVNFWKIDLLFVVSPYVQSSLLQTVIKTMKYRNTYPLATLMGEWMATVFCLKNHETKTNPNTTASFLKFDDTGSRSRNRDEFEGRGTTLVVPVPLHRLREKTRGYNQSRFLAQAVSNALGCPMWEELKRIINTHPQAELSRKDRLKNVENAFILKEKLDLLNKKVILIDDVCSTGATLNACAAPLRAAGVKEICGLVLGRGG